jgi:hypothetical protein
MKESSGVINEIILKKSNEIMAITRGINIGSGVMAWRAWRRMA